MTLEQRVEALEKQIAALSNERLAVKDGEVYINDALIKDGKINAAQIQTAENSTFHLNKSATASSWEALCLQTDRMSWQHQELPNL